ncbi:MAG: urease accessory UreF family protein [Pseudomonadota bacterium]
MSDQRLPLLHLLHLASPALPVGAYAYSQGLEFAIEEMRLDREGLGAWLRDGLELGLANLELPVIRRAFAALDKHDEVRLDALNDELLAYRETEELLLEDQQIGNALKRLLDALKVKTPTFRQKPAYAVIYAVAAHYREINADDACLGYCYSWLENQVTAATKLVPLGQSDAQRLLLKLTRCIPDACDRAKTVPDEALGLSLPGLSLASASHEYQHTRLFRS